MADGQLAINTNATSAGLFFKDAAGDLVKVGPVHVGTSAPNSSPAGSSGNALGEQWLDTSGGGYVFKVWDGSAWRSEPDQFVDVTGDTMTGNLTVPSLNGGPLAGFRNFIINGLFAVDQRENGGATLANTNIFTRDRWQSITQGSGGLVTVGRSAVNLSSAPNADGAADALIYTTTGALSQGASTNLYLSQKIEGRNFRAMSGWLGNTTDRPVTLSFWVKSSVAGTYSISLLRDPTGIGASNLLTYVASYTIDTADTWEKKTITITAPNDSGASITSYVDLSFHVWGGSSRVAASDGWQDAVSALAVVSPSYNANWGSASGQTFEITAVQLEPGPVATPFEHRPLGTELALCQRYFVSINPANMGPVSIRVYVAGRTKGNTIPVPPMRAQPAFINSGSGNQTVVLLKHSADSPTVVNVSSITGTGPVALNLEGSTTNDNIYQYRDNGNQFDFDAEL